MDTERLSVKKDKDIIIPRALFATTKNNFEEDIKKLENLYSHEVIVTVLESTKELISNEVCALVSDRYNTKPFLRYNL
ncbi:hypothetical protein MM239_14255 [Belliella sp. DSM 111904]|uniref:Uncharacterized protein n=2 Tax=Belliella filtrata TaxID=2923435 RepID=A0ABS9V2B7_9BACT|nr:hypothetical protein [Belliella filtrata]MCH7410566.1 hypothetical protein [Belliella filtrata]